MPDLLRVTLSGNNFTGTISESFNNLTRLKVLLLDSNQLDGELPANLTLPALSQFNVSFNDRLNGSIPASLDKLPANSFLGTGLCGGPLGPCPGQAPTPAPVPGPAVSPASAPPGGGSGEVPSPPSGNTKSKKLSGGAIAGIAVGSALGLLIILFVIIFACRRSAGRKTRSVDVGPTAAAPNGGGRGMKPPEEVGVQASHVAAVPTAAAAAAATTSAPVGKRLVFFGPAAASTVAPFDLEDLLRASAEVLGKGVFGTTYKAVLESGVTVAVKRLKEVGLTEVAFRERIAEIGSLEHECLVPLRAYYYSRDEKLLVFDFMAMGSLSALLHGNRGAGRTPLNWQTRSSIALSAARGIEYIHSTSPSASHGNIKSSNVLLTRSYEARVSDHGLATLVGPMSSTVPVTGYRAPEVTDPRRISQKADVYSFGVLLLELLTGKAPTQALLNEEGVDLPRWVQSVVREEWTAEVFDMELLKYQNVEEEMVQLLQLAIDCSSQHPDSRPLMSEVVARIEEIMKSSGKDQQNNAPGAEEGDDRSSARDD